jgi:hypothetical protein
MFGEPLFSHCGELRYYLNSYCFSAPILRSEQRSAGPAEWVQDNVVRISPRTDQANKMLNLAGAWMTRLSAGSI